MRETNRKSQSLAENVAANGPMEERKAMSIARALCSRLMDEGGATGTELQSFHPNTILLSAEGTITFSSKKLPDAALEAYLPPEYVKGSTSRESVLIYGLGMLLLFLVTGQKQTGADAKIKNRTLRSIINRCTTLDSRRRFQSLPELRSALNRELVFPRKLVKCLAVLLLLCLVSAASFYMYGKGRARGEAAGELSGYQAGYPKGYETGVADAPGIGIEDIVYPESYGNLFGNLNSEGGAFAATGEGSVYYASDGRVFRMDPYTGETALLAEHQSLSCLNYWQGYLFYLTEDTLVRLNVRSGSEETVSDRLWGRFCICDGTLFLDDEKSTGYLYGIDAVSLEARQLNAKMAHPYLNAADGKLYFVDEDRESQLFRCNYDGGNMTRLLSRACRDVDLCGERLYCLATDAKSEDAPAVLMSINASSGEAESLTNQPISRFISGENGVFYVSAASGYLEWMTPDGRTRYTICTEAVSDFNLAGRWIFYHVVGDEALYRMRIDGSDSEKLP